LSGIRPVNVMTATEAVFRVLNHHINPDQVANVREALPEEIRALWPPVNQSRRKGQSAA